MQGDMITIALDSSKLDFALTRLALAAKVDLGMVIKEEGRYIVKTLMKFTPPQLVKALQNADVDVSDIRVADRDYVAN